MEKINFQNLPNTTTPLNATNMNLLQTNVENAIKEAGVVVSPTEPTTDRKKVWLQFSGNMYDGTIDKTGYILNADGTETTNEGCFITSYVKVMPNTTYELTYNSTYAQSGMRIGEYTSNKTFIQRLVTSETKYVFTTSSTTEYVKFSAFTSYASNISIIGEYKEHILNNNVYEKFTETIGVGTEVDRKRKVNFIHSKNLLDTSLSTNVTLNTEGEEFASSATKTTAFIKVKAGKTYTFSYDYSTLASSNYRVYAVYNSSKGLIIGDLYNPASKLLTITPSQDGYIRISYDVNCTNLQVEEGTVTAYEPYVTPSINVDGDDVFFSNVYSSKVTVSDYISISNSFTVVDLKAYKSGNIVFIVFDLRGTINEGETVLGSCTNKLVMTMFGNARIMNAQSVLRPATTIAIPSGAFRLYTPISGTQTTGTIILLVND